MGADWTMQVFAPWGLNYLLHSTVLLLALLAAAPLLRTRVRTAETLWRAALLSPLATATLHSVGIADRAALVQPLSGGTLWWSLSQNSGSPLWLHAAFALWIAGAVIGVLHLLWVRIKLARVLSNRHLLDPSELEGRVPPCLIHRIRFSVTPHLTTPVVLGLRELCLPEAALSGLAVDELRAVIAHEVAHLERRDTVWLWLAAITQRLMFVQPLNLIARRRLRELAEFQCDDRAAELSSPIAFASALTTVAAWVERRPAFGALGMAGRESLALRRVRRILNRPDSTPGGGHRALVLAWTLPMFWLGILGPRVELNLAPLGRYTINAFDDAGPFTVTLERGRVLTATMDGEPVPKPSIRQAGPRVSIADAAGRIPLELTVTRQGGLSWKSRPRAASPTSPVF